jgi:hypothetical protein
MGRTLEEGAGRGTRPSSTERVIRSWLNLGSRVSSPTGQNPCRTIVGMGLDKEVRTVIREARRQGFRIAETKKGWMVYGKEGIGQALLHRTPSDPRGFLNDIAQLRRLGFVWKGR